MSYRILINHRNKKYTSFIQYYKKKHKKICVYTKLNKRLKNL